MKKKPVLSALAVLLFALISLLAWAQAASVRVEGTITDAGKPLADVQAVLTNQVSAKTFKVKTDGQGKFVAVGVPAGEYTVEVISPAGESLYRRADVEIVAPGPVPLRIDVSGAPGKYTPEQIEAAKKQDQRATAMNALIQQAMAAMDAKDWQGAVSPLQQLVAMDPGNWQYYSALGDAQFHLGRYDQAVDAYQKGVQAAQSITTADPKNPITDPGKIKVGVAKMLTNQGNAYLKLRQETEAIAAYRKAAALDPHPAIAYFNLCATLYNTGRMEGALEACDQAIAADPIKADAYFIKGSLLLAESTTDKNGTLHAAPGTVEALNKYLELAPGGPHADDVKQMLAYIGAKIETTYKKKAK